MWTFIFFLVFLTLTILAMKGNCNKSVLIFGGITIILFLIMTKFLGIGYLLGGSEKDVAETAVKVAKHSDKWNIETFWTCFYCFGFIACLIDAVICGNLPGGIIVGIFNFFIGFRFAYVWGIAQIGANCYGAYKIGGVLLWFIMVILMHAVIIAMLLFWTFIFHMFGSKIPINCTDVVVYVFTIIFTIFAGNFIG